MESRMLRPPELSETYTPLEIDGKVVLLGEEGVGKTSLIVSYHKQLDQTVISPTIGASFFTCKMMIDNVMVKLQVWDTAGQERFKAMTPLYYRNANSALLVFDLTSYRSFSKLIGWVRELQMNAPQGIIITVIGNKSDLTKERKVTFEEAEGFSRSVNAQYLEASALTRSGVEKVFSITCKLLKERKVKPPLLVQQNYFSLSRNGVGYNQSNFELRSTQSIPNGDAPKRKKVCLC